jgi:branched-chain amino acid transport system permease protein
MPSVHETPPAAARIVHRAWWSLAEWVGRHPLPVILPILVVAPFVADYTPLYTALLAEILVFGLYGLAFDVMLGYTGILSLGHSAFFGVPSYIAGLLLAYVSPSIWLAVPAAVAGGVLVAFLLGGLALRKRGVYFAMLTLALSQVFYYIVRMWREVTGGDDGLSGIPRLRLTFPWGEIPLSKNTFNTYWFIMAVVLLSALTIRRVLRSPLGRAMQAVRDNEQRAASCGLNVQGIRMAAILISGFFAGLAGALLTILIEFAPIENVHWSMSGTVVILTLFGGTGTFLGPFVGAATFLWLKDFVSRTFAYWEMVVGGLFVLIVVFLPDGIVGTIRKALRARMTPGTPAPLAAVAAPAPAAAEPVEP